MSVFCLPLFHPHRKILINSKSYVVTYPVAKRVSFCFLACRKTISKWESRCFFSKMILTTIGLIEKGLLFLEKKLVGGWHLSYL